MNLPEQRLWKELRKLDANFRRQAPIGPYFADFATHGRKWVIEVDGEIHQCLPHIAARDANRRRWLENEGYTIIRFTDREVMGDLHGCAGRVRVALGVHEAEPAGPKSSDILPTSPSPALPPSRRKGEAS